MTQDRPVETQYPSTGAAALAAWCRDHGCSTRALSVRAGFKTDVAGRVIAGERGMGEATIRHLADVTGLSVDLLRGGSLPSYGPLPDVLRAWCHDQRVSIAELGRRVGRSDGFKRVLLGKTAFVDRSLLDELERVTGLDLGAFKIDPTHIATLADAKAAVERKLGAQHEIGRDLERFARGVQRRLQDVPALREAIEPYLGAADAHRRFGIELRFDRRTGKANTKRWSNFRRNLLRALEVLGTAAPARPSRQLGPEWTALFRLAKPLGKPTWAGLSRFARACDAAGIAPTAIDDAAIDVLRQNLERDPRRFGKSDRQHREVIRNTIKRWNGLVDQLGHAGWPQRRLTPPEHGAFRFRCRANDLPRSLHDELRHYAAWARGELAVPKRPNRYASVDPAAGRAEHLAPTTAQRHQKHVLLAAQTLVEIGCRTATELSRIADVVTPSNVELVLAALDERHEQPGGGPNRLDRDVSSYAQIVAASLYSVANFYLRLPADEVKTLARYVALAAPMAKRSGITQHNLDRLRQFDARRIRRFVGLPSEIVHEYVLERRRFGTVTPALAKQSMLATALLLLRICPLRRGTLGRLRWREHFVAPGVRGADGWMVIPAHLTKQRRPIERSISPVRWRVLETYTSEAQPLLRHPDDPGNDHIFPSPKRAGKHLGLDHLSQLIAGVVRDRLDVEVHLHLIRHLLAWIVLREDPDAMGVIARVLDHASVTVTQRYYAALDAELAAKAVDAMLDRAGQPASATTKGARA